MQSELISQWRHISLSAYFFVCVVLVIHIFLPDQWLQYSFQSIGDGEYWRLISASLSHHNWPHLLLNLGAFLMIVLLLPQSFTGISWLMLLLMVILLSNLITMGIYTDGVMYSGLSGPLHGLLWLLCLRNIKDWMGKILLVLLVIKIVVEQIYAEHLFSDDVIGLPVFYDSHLIGVIAAVWTQFLVRIAGPSKRRQ